MPWVYLNNGFVKEEEARLSFRDLAVQRGYGIFEFFRTVDGRPLFLEDHLARFYYSAEQMHLPVPATGKQLRHIIEELISANRINNSGIRITLTGGNSPDGFNIGEPNLIIAEQPFKPLLEAVVHKGVRLITYPYLRPLPDVKSIDYIMAVWLQPYLQQREGDDLLYHQEESVSECPRSNFFILTAAGTLVTPSRHILKGITRKHLLKVAARTCRIEERDISLMEASQAKEAFITSTTKILLPVTHIDGKPVGNGRAGETTLELRTSMQDYISSQ